MTVDALTYWLRVLQALNVAGVLTLIANGFVKSHVEGRSLKPWVGGLIVGAVFGTVILGVPFLIASLRTEIPEMRYIFLQYVVAAGMLMPLWLDPILTIRFAFDRASYTEGPRALMAVLGIIVLIGLIVSLLLYIFNR